MRCTVFRLSVLLLTVLPGAVASAAETWIDLTHSLGPDTIFWPTAEPYTRSTDFEGMTERGYYYSAYSFCTAEHGGTHIDAPVHFAEGKRSVDQIPLEQLIGAAVVIDVRPQVEKDRDHRVAVGDLEQWEALHGPIPEASIVLIRTGFSRYWPDASRYLGTALRGPEGAAALSFPGLSDAAADWLVRHRQVKAVGIDTASIDYGKSREFRTHVRLMRDNVPVFENVANLEALPATGVRVIALPAKLAGGSGGPLRIIAGIDPAAKEP